ncbi:hypothetical protein [Rugosimonospora africana]|uniref:Uncharacterized protein n=1 Tax=Rugosimonospora africana TaxID=556532 RepID=A0A8J3VMN5_9ACTN|nr:hypothetical protein [Rugosimonospora africana]GIH11877.1 hypothetical protein Raf01_00490 [Rugosimonospora africana]
MAKDVVRPTIVFDVGSYGYGSVSMALAVAAEILGRTDSVPNDSGPKDSAPDESAPDESGRSENDRTDSDREPAAHLVALGRGEAVAQLRSSGLFRIVADCSDPAADLRALLPAEPDAWCDFQTDDRRSWRLAADTGVPYVHVNMFAWRVKEAPAVTFHVPQARTLYERYPGFEADAARFGADHDDFVPPAVGRVTGAGPMIEAAPETAAGRAKEEETGDEPVAIVTLGGGRVPGLSDPHAGTRLLATVAVAALRRAAPGLPVHLCCGPSAATALGSTVDGARVRSLPRAEFLDLLGRAAVAVTQPSLHSPYEAMLRGRPTVLLPPQNFTQWFHLRHWEHARLAGTSHTLTCLTPELDMDPFGLEHPQDVALAGAYRRLLDEPAAIETLATEVAGAVRSALTEPAAVRAHQDKLCAGLGGDVGVSSVADVLLAAGGRPVVRSGRP